MNLLFRANKNGFYNKKSGSVKSYAQKYLQTPAK